MVTTEAQAQGEAKSAPRLPTALAALFFPDRGMPLAARIGRVRGPLVFALLCSLLWGAALATRVDARDATLQALDKEQKLATMSDRQIDDAQKTAERGFMVKKLGFALVAPGGELLASALGLFLLSWFLRGRSQASAVFTVAAYGLLPSGLGNLVEAVAVFLRGSIPAQASSFTPRTLAALAEAFGAHLQEPLTKLLSAIDVFDLWGAVMLAFGLTAAAQLPVRRALVGTLLGWLCYRLVRFVALGG